MGFDGPESGAFWSALGKRYAEMGQPGRALGALERAVAADASLPTGPELVGHLYLDRRDFPAAERVHRAFLRVRPGRVEAWLRLGAVLARQSRGPSGLRGATSRGRE